MMMPLGLYLFVAKGPVLAMGLLLLAGWQRCQRLCLQPGLRRPKGGTLVGCAHGLAGALANRVPSDLVALAVVSPRRGQSQA